MKKRELLELIDDLIGVARYQSERINTLEKTVNTVLAKNPELIEAPKLKTLDQSVFDAQDEKFRFAVSNHRGSVFLSDAEPKQHHLFSGWCFDSSHRTKALFGGHVFGDATNWQNSLIERETKREVLDGNERIRRLLEKQKFVMVMVSDDGYTDALSGSELRICDHFNHHDGLYTIDGGAWSYGIPIDNNGNEILYVNENGEIED